MKQMSRKTKRNIVLCVIGAAAILLAVLLILIAKQIVQWRETK